MTGQEPNAGTELAVKVNKPGDPGSLAEPEPPEIEKLSK